MEEPAVHVPSFSVERSGACACDEMGALLAGVFCGVLETIVSVCCRCKSMLKCMYVEKVCRCEKV